MCESRLALPLFALLVAVGALVDCEHVFAEHPKIVGAANCGSAGCHGDLLKDDNRGWNTAYSLFASNDPHRRAFDVLYAQRSVEIYQNLTSDKQQRTELDDTAYFAFLQQRCIGCHATPRAEVGAAERASSAVAKPNDYAAGVSCESCHGPAEKWLHAHYRKDWSTGVNPPRGSTAGFVDLRPMDARAGVCVGCHVGPQIQEDEIFDVNHDLIAAGHPRLTFELNAYLHAYPKHWNEPAGTASHFATWQIGQRAMARQLALQLQSRHEQSRAGDVHAAWPDFANFECFACHRTLRQKPGELRAAVVSAGKPRPALAPLRHSSLLLELAGHPSQVESLHACDAKLFTSARQPAELLAKIAAIGQASASDQPLITNAQAPQFLQRLLEQKRAMQRPSDDADAAPVIVWDDAVQFYLAASAMAADGGPSGERLREPVQQLHAVLTHAENFGGKSAVGQYDSPDGYEPVRAREALESIAVVIQQLQQQTTGAQP